MSFFDKLTGRLTAPKLTPARIAMAVFVALVADALQIPLAVPPAPEIIDVIAMLLTVWLLGFHILLLPTFVIEFIPVAGMLPTWSACVAAVIVLRKREQAAQPPVIDVESTTTSSTQQSLPPKSNSVPPQAPPPRINQGAASSDLNPS
ncbi:MAG TPA: hypothetical protein VFZ59_04665 [Verrucomicrobiae bacterium]|nr:hypothetical protein [Verrucomicrobiae bacterium]